MANGITLGRLEKVALRDAWTSEPGDFTPWLAREENLKLLGETINLELELEAQEQWVGPFRADILCKDTGTDDWVLIENQLERTDHTHLGQLITYAAGLNAVTIVWIAERFTSEHRAALDWLNERTDEKIKLFGLEIELWRIGASAIAPKFNVISQPNDWSRTVQQAAAGTGEVTEHRQLQLRFWTGFRTQMESKSSPVKCQKPSPYQWMNHAVGRTGARLQSVVSTWNSETNAKESEIRAELVLDGPNAKREFELLQLQRAAIETSLGFPLKWDNTEDKASRKVHCREAADFSDEQQWPQQFEWLRLRLEAMYRVLGPIMKQLKVDAVAS